MIACACVAGIALRDGHWHTLIGWLLLVLDPVEPDCQILGRMADVVELLDDQLDLLAQLAGARVRSEFYRLDERALKLLVELVSSLDFEDVVTKGYDIGDRLHLQLLSALEEGSDLPLLVISRKRLLELGPGRDDLHVSAECFRCFRHEPLRAQLDPALCSVGDDQNFAVLLRFEQQPGCALIDINQLLGDITRQGLRSWLVDQLLVWNQE